MADGVVQIGHAYILAAWLNFGSETPHPPFSLLDLGGSTRSLSEYEGKPVAVIFSCCHCPYVIAWEDRLNAAARQVDGQAGFFVINANAGYLGDSPEDMRREPTRSTSSSLSSTTSRKTPRAPTAPRARPRSSSSTRTTG